MGFCRNGGLRRTGQGRQEWRARDTLPNYAYIGARYDREYKITEEQLEQLAPCVKKLHEVTEKICKEKVESFI